MSAISPSHFGLTTTFHAEKYHLFAFFKAKKKKLLFFFFCFKNYYFSPYLKVYLVTKMLVLVAVNCHVFGKNQHCFSLIVKER